MLEMAFSDKNLDDIFVQTGNQIKPDKFMSSAKSYSFWVRTGLIKFFKSCK